MLAFAAPARRFEAPHFVEMVLARAGQPRPHRIETTLDRELQRSVVGIVGRHRDELLRHGARNVAVVVLHNGSGEWLAWEGSGNYDESSHGGRLNGPTIPRQPGSALKPFTYALAFEHDETPASILADVPTHFPTADPAVSYAPQNYDGRFRGPLRSREALAGSHNVPAVALASRVGVPSLLRALNRAGLSTLDKNAAHYGLGLTLGNAEVRLDELVAAYAAFARGGLWLEPTFLAAAGEASHAERVSRLLWSPQTAFWITDILSDHDAREAVFSRGGHLEFPFPVAVKTGTSQAYHDNWTIGYSRHVTVGVWVGNFDRTPLRNSSGVTGAAPIFHAVMLAAERRVGGSTEFSAAPIVSRPSTLQRVSICALSGMRASAWCPTRKMEWLPGVNPPHPCEWHQQGAIVNWPPELRQWASEMSFGQRASSAALHATVRTGSESSRAAAGRPRRAPGDRASDLAILNPPDGATYSIDPTLRREFQALSLRAHAARGGAIEWFVNGVKAGRAPADATVAWPLTPGTHRIQARDPSGRSAESLIVVR
jgi:penicillin-binding protein 1C